MKDLLIKFYDKIILGILLLGLAATMTLLTLSLQDARNTVRIADEDIVNTVAKKAEIPPLDESMFSATVESDQSIAWKAPSSEGSLLDPGRYTSARDGSPYLLHYSTRVNPFNKKPDLGPEEGGASSVVANADSGTDTITGDDGEDSDGDGIPDSVETAQGKNPNFAGDANVDSDGDGFSDLEEYRFKTRPDSVESRPPLATLLRFHKVIAEPLPIMLYNVTPTDPEDKSTWDIQVRVKERGRTRQRFTKIGRTITGTNFKVIDASFTVAIKSGVTQRVFQIVVQAPGGEPVSLTEKKVAYGADSYYQFAYVLTWPPKALKATLGETITLPDKSGKTEVYTLVSVTGGITVESAANQKFKVQRFNAARDQARITAGSREALAPLR